MKKSFSQSCENNKKPIIDVIGNYFDACELILEIGSGTAQHAEYFAGKLKNSYWQTSDQQQNLEGINQRLNGYTHYNLGRPVLLDVLDKTWPIKKCDGVFSANTSHIMNWEMVEKMFEGVGRVLLPKKTFCLYGPFNFNGKYTASSNEAFDKMLKERDPESGLRNFEDLQILADQQDMDFVKRYDLPSNNCILTWQHKS
ncbi:MAG: methylase [Gammaproteobacteria bacterium]|nr:MAG: methylase [Gammaproteobacteria bacterium]